MAPETRRWWCTGDENLNNSTRKHERYKLSNAANLSFGTWNCGGLSQLKKDLISAKNIDVLCVTETHEWRDHDPLVVYSEPPTKRDKYDTYLVHNGRVPEYKMNLTGLFGEDSMSRQKVIRIRRTPPGQLVKCKDKWNYLNLPNITMKESMESIIETKKI